MPVSRRLLIFTGIIALLFVGSVIATRQLLTAPYPGHNDFVTPWEAARSFWLEGIPVYSDASNENIQRIIYGRPIESGEFPNYYAYPFYTIVMLLPLVYLPFDWASAAWMVILEACLLGALALMLDVYRWKPRPLLLALLVIFALFFYPAARGLILGQVSHAIYLAQVLALWALLKRRDALAGVALGIATMKPQMSYLIIPFVLLWALRERRWRVVGAFGVMFGGLLALSFILQPTWVSDWVFELQRYTTYTEVGSPVWVLTQFYLNLGAAGEWAVSLVLYGVVLWAWYGVIVQRRHERWLWAALLTLTITHLVAPRTATTHFVVFSLPLWFYMAALSRRGHGLIAAGLLLALLILPWLHTVSTIDGEFEHQATYLPLPFFTLALLLVWRAGWERAASPATQPVLERAS